MIDDSECPFQREGSDGKMGEFNNKICLAGIKMISPIALWGFPGGASGKEPTCSCRRLKRLGFDPWVEKIPWSMKWQSTPVFLLGKPHGQRSLAGNSPWGRKQSDMT